MVSAHELFLSTCQSPITTHLSITKAFLAMPMILTIEFIILDYATILSIDYLY